MKELQKYLVAVAGIVVEVHKRGFQFGMIVNDHNFVE